MMYPTFLHPVRTGVFVLGLNFIMQHICAQTHLSVGPTLGVNISSANYRDANSIYAYNNSYVSRFEGGIVASIRHRHVALQPALLYSQKGFVLSGNYRAISNTGQVGVGSVFNVYSLNYLTLPVNLVYAQKANGQGFQLFGGGYVGRLLGGRVLYDNYQGVEGGNRNHSEGEIPVRAGNEFQNDGAHYVQRYDAGLQAGIGFQLKGLQVQVAYSQGLTNLQAHQPLYIPTEEPNYHNKTVHASIAYLFTGRQSRK
ncbi:outer membrane beta-barrel protein [Hymenobacter bucti]|uniref:Outer membrane beta-barrel protein n=1 Tax=Hymenobacter bucti TaxID=1844114 RepID=A0ABW4QZ18_9BACT